MTIRNICTRALQELGVVAANNAPTDSDIQLTRESLNALIGSLSTEILNIFTINRYYFPVLPNVSTYKLGPATDAEGNPTGATWVTERPMRIERAILKVYAGGGASTLPAPSTTIIETPSTLSISQDPLNFQQYASITVREIRSSWPTSFYDDRGFPVRTIKIWPVPQQSLQMELWLWDPLPEYASLDDPLNLPPGYERYLSLKLAQEVCDAFQCAWTPTLAGRLTEAEDRVKSLNQGFTRSAPSMLARGVTRNGAGYINNDNLSNRLPRLY